MTDLPWIFPNPYIKEAKVRAFEHESILTYSDFTEADLLTAFGTIKFFVFTPDRSMSVDADYKAFANWTSTFAKMCVAGKLSERMGCMAVFDGWNKANTPSKATMLTPPLIASICSFAKLKLGQQDFINLQRVTLFCIPRRGPGFDVNALTTRRQSSPLA